MNQKNITTFQKTVWDFYKKNKRDFPWRETQNPYHILVSEIMLQQTQAERVVRFYEAFLKKFPEVESLAKASFAEVYEMWQGLGYNRRAMALKKSAEKSVAEYQGTFPKDIEELQTFPGIGPYTARAVSIFSFNAPEWCIETNIRRVLIHFFLHKKKVVNEKEIIALAEKTFDKKNSREWHWAMMDYGAYLKTVEKNANRKHKDYRVQSKFEGSLRQIRGAILRMLSGEPMKLERLIKNIKREKADIEKVLASLKKEGMITVNKKIYSLK